MPPGGPDPIEPPPGLDTPRVDTAAGPRSRRHVAKAIIDKGKYHAATAPPARARARPLLPRSSLLVVFGWSCAALAGRGGARAGRPGAVAPILFAADRAMADGWQHLSAPGAIGPSIHPSRPLPGRLALRPPWRTSSVAGVGAHAFSGLLVRVEGLAGPVPCAESQRRSSVTGRPDTCGTDGSATHQEARV